MVESFTPVFVVSPTLRSLNRKFSVLFRVRVFGICNIGTVVVFDLNVCVVTNALGTCCQNTVCDVGLYL